MPEYDSTIEILSDSFREILKPETSVKCIAEGFRFTEGPVWRPDKNCLLFSDIPGDTIYCWREGEGHKAWRKPSRHANGNTLDREGRLLTCEHGSRTLTRTEADGSVTTLADKYAGKPLNSPNDVIVQRDGTIWFTDPPYGIKPEQSEQDANYVFRLDPAAEELVPVAEDFPRPNGLCFSPDETLLYVADSDTSLHHIRVFRVKPDKTLEGGEVFVTIDAGVPDGIRADADGRLYSSAKDGVHVFSPGGELLGKLHTPETTANCTFGGPGNHTLFFTATTRVWAAELAVGGAV